jgi:hypothetical protein
MEDILIGNTGSGISYQPYAGAAEMMLHRTGPFTM